MITHKDLQKEYYECLNKRNEIQARLRRTASELVQSYRDSLDFESEHNTGLVTTGYLTHEGYISLPVTNIEIENNKTLKFIITTTIDSNPSRKFAVSISLALREQDELVSISIESDPVPVLLLGEGAEERFAEAVESIKVAAMKKIKSLL